MLHGDLVDVCAVSAEVTVAELIATAANHHDASGVSTIQLRLLNTSDDSRSEWSRRERDALLLCVDRAVSRVYPPLDPLQYTQTPPEFVVGEDMVKVARLHITSSRQEFYFVSGPHCVEGSSLTRQQTQSADGDCSSGGGGGACDGASEAATDARRRWRRAAWMTARIFNEGGWYSAEKIPAKHDTRGNASSGCDNVLEAAMRCHEKRFLHVDVFGMEIIGLIVALTSRYAYVAVPLLQEMQTAPQWVLVSRVGIPSVLAEGREMTRKRGRSDNVDGRFISFGNEREVMSHDEGPLLHLPPEQRVQVTVRTHKVYCKRQSMADNSLTTLSVTFEDAAVLLCTAVRDEEQHLMESLTSFSDVLQIVRESCARFVRGYKKCVAATSKSAEEWLFNALTDTVSVRMKKTRNSDGRSPVTVASPQDISSLVEGTCVEFKARVGKWHDAADAARSGEKRGIMNLERVRHTIAAMASTLGGVLLIGVTDDGSVIGHARDALKELRLTGFCPAMAKGNVTVAEMRVIAGDRPTEMPKEWWKKSAQAAGGQRPAGGAADAVVTVVTVGRGQAPFYATSRHSAPYTRGLASTVPLHVVICARRVADLLP